MSSKHETFLDIADRLGQLSTCPRKAVGALIVKDGRCISWGYNGAPPGLPHCEENHHGRHPDEYLLGGPDLPCLNATHAEANALAFAARQGISTDGGTLYVSITPCHVCARLLIAAGIVTVIAREAYRDEEPIILLDRGGIRVFIGAPA
jgi:dCMP deaminase